MNFSNNGDKKPAEAGMTQDQKDKAAAQATTPSDSK